MADYVSDQCISRQTIIKFHNQFSRGQLQDALDHLGHRETSLYSYILFCAAIFEDAARDAGANEQFVKKIHRQICISLLTVIEAQREAHYELWNDFIGDWSLSTNDTGAENG